MLKLNLQYFGHLTLRANSLEKILMLRKIRGRRRGRQRTRWLDGSPTQQTWVWASSWRWWGAGRPGVPQSMGLQRVEHYWATEQHMEMMLDKKKIWLTFLLGFKLGQKAAETTHSINNAFGPGTANEQTVQWWFKKFCKGDQSLEDEEHSGWPSEVDNDQLRAIINADPLYNYKRSCQRTQKSAILCSFSIRSKSERWKSSRSGCLMSWPQIKKIVVLKCHLLLFYTNTVNHFSIGLWCAMISGFYSDNQQQPAQCLNREKAPEHFPKPNLHQIKVMVTVWWPDLLQLS